MSPFRHPWLPMWQLILAALAAPAAAQGPPCAPHDVVAATLAEQWGETRRMVALDATGAMVEVWASGDTGTWTLTVTRPGGPTCLVSSGVAWEAVKEPQGEPA